MQFVVLLNEYLGTTSKVCCVAAAGIGYNGTLPAPGTVQLWEAKKVTTAKE